MSKLFDAVAKATGKKTEKATERSTLEAAAKKKRVPVTKIVKKISAIAQAMGLEAKDWKVISDRVFKEAFGMNTKVSVASVDKAATVTDKEYSVKSWEPTRDENKKIKSGERFSVYSKSGEPIATIEQVSDTNFILHVMDGNTTTPKEFYDLETFKKFLAQSYGDATYSLVSGTSLSVTKPVMKDVASKEKAAAPNIKKVQSAANIEARIAKGIKLPKGSDDLWPEKKMAKEYQNDLKDPSMKNLMPKLAKGENAKHFWVSFEGELAGAVYGTGDKWYAFMGTSTMCLGAYSSKELAAYVVVSDFNG